jgi:hypothetical protein
MGKVVRRIASPITRRVNGRIDGRAEELHQEVATFRDTIGARMEALSADIETLNRYLPLVVNVIESQNASRREVERQLRACLSRVDALATGAVGHEEAIIEIRDRIEFVRKELLEQGYARELEADRREPQQRMAGESDRP